MEEKLKSIEVELEAPADFTSPDVLYEDLVKSIRKYHPSDDLGMVEKAYQIARDAHKDQKRKSGEPYIIHPLWVAIILADLEMDKETIAAGMLHDVEEKILDKGLCKTDRNCIAEYFSIRKNHMFFTDRCKY